MSPEDAAFIGDLRAKVLDNTRNGRPPHTGMDREALKKAIAMSRQDYTANQSKSKAAGVKTPSGGGAPGGIDLAALFAPSANATKPK